MAVSTAGLPSKVSDAEITTELNVKVTVKSGGSHVHNLFG